MTFDVYPDACAARLLGAGLREATDLVGDGCITNLADLAEWVKTWPDHNAWTEPESAEITDMYLDGFEVPDVYNTPTIGTGFLRPWLGDPIHGSPWTFEGRSGLSEAVSPWICDNVSPDPLGDQFAFVGSATARISQEMTDLSLGAVYKISFFEATRTWGEGSPYYAGWGNDLRVIIDEGLNTEVMIYNNSDVDNITWEERTTDEFVAARPLQSLTFRSTNPRGGDCGTLIDGVTLEIVSDMSPSPGHDADIQPDSELELSWVNWDPNKPGDPVYVDVWFGTDPNDLPPPTPPDYDYNLIVDADVDGQNANSVIVDANTPGTYYWQVNSYIYGNPTDDPIEGYMWKFHVSNDASVSVDAGVDWVTWSGQELQLDATIDDDGVSALIIDGWSAVPADGVVFTPNDGGDGSTSSAEDPTVTITKATGNPSAVKLTFSAHDAVSSDEDFLMIYVYDTGCLAAIGEDGVEIDTGDFDVDCDTDLEDYATLAEQWLVYNELTTSIVKP
jgi:hypothetical protein